MNLHPILCKPFAWTEKIFPCLALEEYPQLKTYFHGRIVEIFCRGGRWGAYLNSNGHTWSGMDIDPQALEGAFLRGLFSVSVGLFPDKESCDMIFSPLAPFSLISHDDFDAFVQGVRKALSSKGTVLLSLWEEPDVKCELPLMRTYNGQEKIAMACSAHVVENTTTLHMKWMVAKEGQEPYYEQSQEKRYLHYAADVRRRFLLHFEQAEIRTIAGRKWLFAKKS